jgi:hypothetical protein
MAPCYWLGQPGEKGTVYREVKEGQRDGERCWGFKFALGRASRATL